MDRLTRWLPIVVVVLGISYIGSSARPAPAILDPYTRQAWMGPLRSLWSSGPSSNPRDQMNLAAFGKLPALDLGRIKPIDTFARNHLMVLSGREGVARRRWHRPTGSPLAAQPARLRAGQPRQPRGHRRCGGPRLAGAAAAPHVPR